MSIEIDALPFTLSHVRTVAVSLYIEAQEQTRLQLTLIEPFEFAHIRTISLNHATWIPEGESFFLNQNLSPASNS